MTDDARRNRALKQTDEDGRAYSDRCLGAIHFATMTLAGKELAALLENAYRSGARAYDYWMFMNVPQEDTCSPPSQ